MSGEQDGCEVVMFLLVAGSDDQRAVNELCVCVI